MKCAIFGRIFAVNVL